MMLPEKVLSLLEHLTQYMVLLSFPGQCFSLEALTASRFLVFRPAGCFIRSPSWTWCCQESSAAKKSVDTNWRIWGMAACAVIAQPAVIQFVISVNNLLSNNQVFKSCKATFAAFSEAPGEPSFIFTSLKESFIL
jgi:hypothetical protein